MKNERLTDSQKNEIIELHRQGIKVSEIASRLNLSVSGVYRVLDKHSSNNTNEDIISELKNKISSLEEDNKRLLLIIETLVKNQK